MEVAELREIAKALISGEFKPSPLKDSSNEDHPYLEPGWEQIREEMSWHLLGRFPAYLYDAKYPTEDPEWWNWRKANHQPITQGSITRIKNKVRQTFNDSNWTIQIDDESREYIFESENFYGMSFMDWFYSEAWEMTPLDPNGVIVPMPVGVGVEDSAVQVDVKLLLIPSYKILCNKANLLIFEAPKADGVWWVIDKEWYYIIEKTSQETYSIIEYYNHNTNTMMWQVLGGFSEKREEGKIYDSWFRSFVPFGNDALSAYSNYKVVEAQSAHPIRVELERVCDYTEEHDGVIVTCDGGSLYYDGSTHVCPNCGGKGYVPIVHPGHAIVKPRTKIELGEATPDSGAEIEYIQPPIEAIEALKKSYMERLELAEKAISLDRTLEAQSGIAKELDREDQRTLISLIAQWEFGTVIQNTVYNIIKLRNPNTWESLKPSVVVPNDFKLKTAGELLEELKVARESGMPDALYTELAREYTLKRFPNQFTIQRKIELAFRLDYLHIQDKELQNLLSVNGSADVFDLTASNHTYNIIEEILFDNGETALQNPYSWWEAQYQNRIEQLRPDESTMADFGTAE